MQRLRDDRSQPRPRHRAGDLQHGPGILAWGAVAHEARAVEGGYRVTARWDFASGSRQASWLGAHVRIVNADGTPRKNADSSPEMRTILFPLASAVMHDVWQAIGLAGTGTDSYEVHDLFIPDRFAAFRDVAEALREPGPLYRLPTGSTFSLGFAAVSLGVARATLDAAIALARAKHPSLAASAMRDNQAVQGLIGRTEADLRAARAYLYATASAMWRDLSATNAFSPAQRSAVRLAATWTIQQSAKVVDTAYHMAGATAVFRSNPFERRFRDMHAITQQIQARDTHYEDVGKMILAENR
ncbi:alkylation response protein AidB-like acyl-CoA dehydrogenase [Bradyrhizobium sp. S3.12.5]